MLTVEDAWVWDFWLADDGEGFHTFFLRAPRSLGQADRRHRVARIGHAVSADLTTWEIRPSPFDVGVPGSFDETATWTGCVVQGDDGMWRMFYTGSQFLADEPAQANIQTIGVATSGDLDHWVKQPGPILRADPLWYETWGTSGWKEEAWRDPWVFRDPSGRGWHMLVTARANHGELHDRGVIGHAVSADLDRWEVLPPLSRPGAGFAHLEVPQVIQVEGRWILLFSCTGRELSSELKHAYGDAGTWAAVIHDPVGPFDMASARPLTSQEMYSGRVMQDRDGGWAFLAFHNQHRAQRFVGGISDPVVFGLDSAGRPTLTPPFPGHRQ